MRNIVVDYKKSVISLSSAFEKRAFIPGTDEYKQLQAVRADFPEFRLVTRQFKTNTKQERYRGLNYDYMRDYISKHEEDPKPVLAALEEMIGVSKCHSLGKRYPEIKKWFLERYPAVAEFGTSPSKAEEKAEETSDNVTNLPAPGDEKIPA